MKLDRAWVEFSQARARLAEVMSDDELRAFGINVEVTPTETEHLAECLRTEVA